MTHDGSDDANMSRQMGFFVGAAMFASCESYAI